MEKAEKAKMEKDAPKADLPPKKKKLTYKEQKEFEQIEKDCLIIDRGRNSGCPTFQKLKIYIPDLL